MSTADNNYVSYYGVRPDTSSFRAPDNPGAYDDIAKFSDCAQASMNGKYVPGGKENAIDAVRGRDYMWRGCTLGAGGEASAVVKGAIDGWAFVGCTFESRAGLKRKWHLEIGQHSKYWQPGDPPTRGGLIERCCTTTGAPLQVVLWNAERPAVVDSNVRITKVPWLVWWPYFFTRYVWQKIKEARQ